MDEFKSLSEVEAISGRLLIDWTKTFEGTKLLHRERVCLDCDDGKNCRDCVIKVK